MLIVSTWTMHAASAGEIMFYPSNWWHQTLNLDPLNIGMVCPHFTVCNPFCLFRNALILLVLYVQLILAVC